MLLGVSWAPSSLTKNHTGTARRRPRPDTMYNVVRQSVNSMSGSTAAPMIRLEMYMELM